MADEDEKRIRNQARAQVYGFGVPADRRKQKAEFDKKIAAGRSAKAAPKTGKAAELDRKLAKGRAAKAAPKTGKAAELDRKLAQGRKARAGAAKSGGNQSSTKSTGNGCVLVLIAGSGLTTAGALGIWLATHASTAHESQPDEHHVDPQTHASAQRFPAPASTASRVTITYPQDRLPRLAKSQLIK